MLTPDEIRALPAAWYAEQPVPLRLLIALGEPVSALRVARLKLPKAERRALLGEPVKRSAVERAHARSFSWLGRRTP